MKIQNKNRIIVLIALISMLLMVIPANNVLALSYTNSIDFEYPPGVKNTQFDDGFMKTKRSKYGGTVDFNVTDVNPRSGLLDFHVSAPTLFTTSYTLGWWNFTYPTSNYMTKIKIGFGHVSADASGCYQYMVFYNKTTQQNKLAFNPPTDANAMTQAMIKLNFVRSSGNYLVQTKNGQFFINATQHEFVEINVINDAGYQDVVYTNYLKTSMTIGSTVVPYNSTSFINNCRIDSCYIYSGVPGTTGCSVYYDDLNFTISDSYAGSGTSGCLDTTGLTQVGHFGYCAGDVQTSHVYKKYNIPVTTTVSGIELQVSPDQFSEDPDLTHYELSINGLNIGNPICFNPESYYYVLQWDPTYTVTNDLLTFDFYHSQKTGNRYWAIGESCSSTDDLDADGDISYQYTDYTVSYEWKWILFIPFHVPVSTPYTLTRNRDLSMRWWCSGFPAQETYKYPTTLGLHNYYSYNTTGYIYDVTLGYDTITGSYTLDNPALTYKLNLYRNNTKLYQYGFPMNCRYPGSGFGFAPNIIGKYRVQLNSTHALANVTAWVIGTFAPYKISTNPTVTNQYENYNVDYRYYHPQGYAGGAAMDYFPNMLNKFTDCFYQRYPLTNNQSASFLYSTNSSIAEYWGLYAYSNNLYSKLADTTHYIRIPAIFDNDIHPLLPNLVITGNNQNNNQMVLQGTHIFPGSHVSVYVNGIFLGDVGDSQYFTISYTPSKIGTFNATLILFQNNSQVLLDYCSFTVSSSDTEPVPGSGGLGFDIHDFIPFPYDLFVCIGFIIFMVMLPTIIVVSLQKKVTVQINIPPMVMTVASIMSGFLGFFLTVMWGLLSWVWFFAFTFTLIVILTLLYYSGHKSGGGGNATQ